MFDFMKTNEYVFGYQSCSYEMQHIWDVSTRKKYHTESKLHGPPYVRFLQQLVNWQDQFLPITAGPTIPEIRGQSRFYLSVPVGRFANQIGCCVCVRGAVADPPIP